jgi:hypothetical protein
MGAAAAALTPPVEYEILDGVPVLVARGARSFHPGWLAEVARCGKGSNDRYFYGVRLLLAVSASGVAGNWLLAAGNVQERWLAELLLSTRAGCPQLLGPLDPQPGSHNSSRRRSGWVPGRVAGRPAANRWSPTRGSRERRGSSTGPRPTGPRW